MLSSFHIFLPLYWKQYKNWPTSLIIDCMLSMKYLFSGSLGSRASRGSNYSLGSAASLKMEFMEGKSFDRYSIHENGGMGDGGMGYGGPGVPKNETRGQEVKAESSELLWHPLNCTIMYVLLANL